MNTLIHSVFVPLAYLLSAVLFIFGLKKLARVRTARNGNCVAAGGMLLAVVAALVDLAAR